MRYAEIDEISIALGRFANNNTDLCLIVDEIRKQLIRVNDTAFHEGMRAELKTVQRVSDEEILAMAGDFDANMQAAGRYPSVVTAWKIGARAIQERILGGTK